MTGFHYTPFYCEENAWHLCQHPRLANHARHIVFISNDQRCCPLWFQRAAPKPTEAVLWDYHVLVIAQHPDQPQWQVWDLDTLLAIPIAIHHYIEATFGPSHLVPDVYHPKFRVVEAERFVTCFSSDRSHMRDDDGTWLQPPPAWECILDSKGTMNLMQFVDMTQDFLGTVMDRGELLHHFGEARAGS
ncbi:MAG: protein N-terminal glutamine amidohydrolase [Myxococcota bacterium]